MKPTLLDHLVTQKKYQQKTYLAQQIICEENCLQTKIFRISKGAVKISHFTKNGDEIIPIILTDHMIFGADSIFGQHTTAFSSESLIDTEVQIFEMKDVNNAIKEHPSYHIDLLKILNDKYSEAENRIRALNIRSAEMRLIEALLEFKNKLGYECNTSGDTLIKLPFDQESLGRYIRVSRETVCLLISNLKSNSLLDCRQNTIVLSKENLRKLYKKYSFIGNEYTRKASVKMF